MTLALRRIERTTRGRARLDAALRIYRETILPEAQNPERQILYWIDHSQDELADQFRCFSLQKDRTVIGYLQYSYFREEHLLFFEYLCLQGKPAEGLGPNRSLKLIEDHLAQTYSPGFTIVFEVARRKSLTEIWERDDKLIKYFARLGFRTVDFAYQYPVLQSYSGQHGFPADLMVRLPNERTLVSPSEMRTILRSIYFKHYLRWDRPFLEPDRFAERERLINLLYTEQVRRIDDEDKFSTTGDDRRTQKVAFQNKHPRIGALLERVFGPKLPRLVAVMLLLLGLQRVLGSVWTLLIFIPAVTAIYCLAEDTEASRKLAASLIARVRLVSLQKSLSPQKELAP